jgi:SAM-dependent methyltransferase
VSDNPFDRLARYYDLEHLAFQNDLPLYLGLASRLGGPLLEVACGSGRVLLPLAEAGYQVVGLDSSPAMLALARDRLAARPGLAGRVELIEQDLRSARLARRFKLVICALDSFALLLDRAEQLRALRTLARHLEPNGLLVLDVGNGNRRGGEPAEETSLQVVESAPPGPPLTKLVLRRTDPAEQLDRLLHLYDEPGPDGAIQRTAVELTLRYFTRFELELLLERAGFFVEALFGDYDLSPFSSDSERLIALAHVRRAPSG